MTKKKDRDKETQIREYKCRKKEIDLKRRGGAMPRYSLPSLEPPPPSQKSRPEAPASLAHWIRCANSLTRSLKVPWQLT